jgi:hypothetical protein
MTKRASRYIFGAAVAGAALAPLLGAVQKAEGATIASFGFETLTGTSGAGTSGVSAPGGTMYFTGPIAPDSGVGSAYGAHASSSVSYTYPSGNGSSKALSSQQWAPGDYYQFSVPTTSLTGVQIAFDETSSATGPAHFTLQYSTDGSNFSSFTGYTLGYFSYTTTTSNTSASTTGTATGLSGFSSGTSNPAFSTMFDLSGITDLNNDPSAAFRLVDADTGSLNGGTVGTAGTDRVDNFVVSGAATPEPAAMSLMILTAAGALGRRRRNPD